MKVSKFGVILRITLHRIVTGVNIGHLNINSCSLSTIIQDNINHSVLVDRRFTTMTLFNLNIIPLSSQILQTLNTQLCVRWTSLTLLTQIKVLRRKKYNFALNTFSVLCQEIKFLECNKQTTARKKIINFYNWSIHSTKVPGMDHIVSVNRPQA